jgi:pimeloyl-ACP methyl ester carboxylesterase
MKALINGISLAYGDVGKGSAVVLIHGFPLCRGMWKSQVEAISAAGFRLITPDLRGFGESDAPEGAYSMSLFADDIVALLDYLGIEKAVIGGMSMGGYVLLNILERYPERTSAACFIATRSTADDEAVKEVRLALLERTKLFGVPTVAEMFSSRVFSGEAAEKRDLHRNMYRWMSCADIAGVEGTLHALMDRKDYTPFLATFTLPSIVIGGDQDITVPLKDLRALTERLPDCELCIIRDAGHMVNVEQPSAFNDCLLRFLRRVSGLSTTISHPR